MPEFVTREGIVALANERGIPLTKSRVNKMAMHGNLKPDATYGPTHLYRTETATRLVDELAAKLVASHEPEAA